MMFRRDRQECLSHHRQECLCHQFLGSAKRDVRRHPVSGMNVGMTTPANGSK
jgi:hypothetical protein